MSSQHRPPLVAFVALAAGCLLLLTYAIRVPTIMAAPARSLQTFALQLVPGALLVESLADEHRDRIERASAPTPTVPEDKLAHTGGPRGTSLPHRRHRVATPHHARRHRRGNGAPSAVHTRQAAARGAAKKAQAHRRAQHHAAIAAKHAAQAVRKAARHAKHHRLARPGHARGGTPPGHFNRHGHGRSGGHSHSHSHHRH